MKTNQMIFILFKMHFLFLLFISSIIYFFKTDMYAISFFLGGLIAIIIIYISNYLFVIINRYKPKVFLKLLYKLECLKFFLTFLLFSVLLFCIKTYNLIIDFFYLYVSFIIVLIICSFSFFLLKVK